MREAFYKSFEITLTLTLMLAAAWLCLARLDLLPTRVSPRFQLCVEGVGPACDPSITYTKAECEAAPQMSGWAPGTNPFGTAGSLK